MARKRNAVKTIRVTVSTTPIIHQYLCSLVATGLYGKTPPDAAERLIARGIEAAISDGVIHTTDK